MCQQRSKFDSAVGKCQGFCQGISMFLSICLSKKDIEAIEFLGLIKKYFPRIKPKFERWLINYLNLTKLFQALTNNKI